MKLWEKNFDDDGCTYSIVQPKRPFLEVLYNWFEDDYWDGKHHKVPEKQWTFVGVNGPHMSPGSSGILYKGKGAEGFAKALARYMILLRPWEARSGVEFQITRVPKKEKGKPIRPLEEASDIPPVDMCGVAAVRINHTYSLIRPEITE